MKKIHRFLAASLGAFMLFGLAQITTAQSEKPLSNTPAEDAATLEKLKLFGDVLAIVKEQYVEEVDDADLIEKALNGALESLDPHSSYVPPVQFEEQIETNRREYGGLGVEVTSENELVKINYAIEDGPAYKAGIRSGDYITRVEGESIRGKELDDAVKDLRGIKGTPITITVLTPNQTPRDVVVIRDQVRGRAVRHRMIRDMGYIFIETFSNDRLTKDTVSALSALQAEAGGKLPGLVIDLRGNRGGLLNESIGISSLFLDSGEVLSSRGRTPDDTERYHAEPGEFQPDMPIMVLINSGSASAAEIVAGAIQDRGRGIILGSRSFGKGSVQSVIPLISDGGGALRLTTERYYTPSGKSIQGRGIIPDIKVALFPDDGDRRKRFREGSFRNALSNPDDTQIEDDFDNVSYPPEGWPDDKDFQLETAIDILKTSRYRTLLAEQGW
jgi:carboxyl-terminal processing protease